MLAGGAESCIHPLAIVGFERSRSLTISNNNNPAKASQPFNADRSGFVIGEGAAVLVLEELNHALKRGAQIYAHVSGYAATADAHHLTQPPADGDGAFRSMQRSLASAGIKPRDVSYINAHATSTIQGDAAETCAIRRLMLGESGVEREEDVCTSGTKGATGHLLGAAGAMEALFSVLALKNVRLYISLALFTANS
jgi:3-oxoacyl-[acyl-carrier-protein] synthase II